MRTVLLLRPEPDASRMAERLRKEGFSPILSPLMRIVPVQASFPQDISGIILTSPHGLTEQARALSKHLPVYCVGTRAQEAARKAGFTVAQCVETSEALRGVLPQKKLLYLSGEHVHGDLGPSVERVVTYEAEATHTLNDEAKAVLSQAIVLLTSKRSVQLFVEVAGGVKANVVCLSPAIAEEARAKGLNVAAIAASPNEDALIAALVSSC